MDRNLTKFLKDLGSEVETAKDHLNDKIQGTGKVIFEQLMKPKREQGTPKITGHLRSNWIVTLDSKFEGIVGSKENVDKTLRDSKFFEFLNTPDLYNHTDIFFNNNVEYGVSVNYGTETQPPQKFKEKAIQEGDQWLKANSK